MRGRICDQLDRMTNGVAMVLLGMMALVWVEQEGMLTQVAASVNQPNPVTVVAPNGGERIAAGSTYTITWTIAAGTQVFGHHIYLSTDGGETFERINERTVEAAARSYQWQIPSHLETTRARIQVLALNPNEFLYDISDRNFTIFRPNVPPVQENVTLGRANRNRLTVRLGRDRTSGELQAGFVDLVFSPTNDPATLAVELNACSFVGESLSVGNKPTGQLLLSKEHTTVARGTFDATSGDFQIPVSIALLYDGLIWSDRPVNEDPDVRQSPRPVIFPALLEGRRATTGAMASGTLEGTLPADAPLLGGARIELDWSGRLTAGNKLTPTVFCPTYCIDAKVIADDASGKGAVVTPEQIQGLLAEVNATWSQGAIEIRLRDADPATAGTQVTYIPAGTLVVSNGRTLTDGDLRRITNQPGVITDEMTALTSLARDERCIDLYLVDRLESARAGPLPERGVTINGGMGSAAIILARSGSPEAELGTALAHHIGHALGLTQEAVPSGNAMFEDGLGGFALNASQCLTAGMVNPLAQRLSCRDRFFDPLATDVVIIGLDGPNAVVRGVNVTTTIVGRGLAGAQAVEFSTLGLTAEILNRSDTRLTIRLNAATHAATGPSRFLVRTPNGVASSGIIVINVR
ncbi:MAG: hypothetical protein RMM98_16330 [Acidobacteriota bacterium]|nr:GPI anchored serine-threonine rich family protein [Blastocatellia bacterium]MDW8241171.1 hypothetical protein [Acidobacteriota bacterium]